MFSGVVLPEPQGPTMQTVSPAWRADVRSRTATAATSSARGGVPRRPGNEPQIPRVLGRPADR
jgi:hypothetical protein